MMISDFVWRNGDKTTGKNDSDNKGAFTVVLFGDLVKN